MIQYNTPEEYRADSSLSLCYTDEQILPLCGRPLLDALLSIPGDDACWFLAGALPQAQRVEWAQACARRAKEYAAANAAAANATAAASAAATATAYAAATAATAAATAYAYATATDADADAYRKAEYSIAVRHGVMLLEGVKK